MFQTNDLAFESEHTSEIYGWFESGGQTQSFLSNVAPIDVTLRTNNKDSKIIFGNSPYINDSENLNIDEENAGMYIFNNRVGIATIPNDKTNDNLLLNGNFGIHGNQTFYPHENNNNNNPKFSLQLSSSNISLTSFTFLENEDNRNENLKQQKTEINGFGEIRNKTLISENIHIDNNQNENVDIIKITKNFSEDDPFRTKLDKGYTMQTEFTWYDKFAKDRVFILYNIKFKVKEVELLPSSNDLPYVYIHFIYLYPEQIYEDFVLPTNKKVSIQFLDLVLPYEPQKIANIINSETLKTLVNITSYSWQNDKKQIKIIATLSIENDFLDLQNRYSSNRDDIFRESLFYYFQKFVADYKENDNLDRIILCKNVEPVILPKNIKQYELTFSGVDNESINDYFEDILKNVDEKGNALVFFYPLNIPTSLGNIVPQALKFVVTSTQNVLSAKTVQYEIEADEFTINYLLNDKYSRNIANDSVYIIEPSKNDSGLWKIENFKHNELTKGRVTLQSFYLNIQGQEKINTFNSKRTLYAYFFSLKNVNRIGNSQYDTFIPYNASLGVGTSICPEKVTVNGAMSCRDHFLLYNFGSKKPFHIQYDDDILRINIDNKENNVSRDFIHDPKQFANLKFIDINLPKKRENEENKENIDVHLNTNSQFTRNTYFSELNDEIHTLPSAYFKINGHNLSSIYKNQVNNELDIYGSSQSKIIQTDDIKTSIFIIKQVEIVNAYYQRSFYDLEHNKIDGIVLQTNIIYKSRLAPHDIIRIDNSLFRILRTNIPQENPDFRFMYVYLEWYFPQEREKEEKKEDKNLQAGQIKDIIVYKGLNIKNERLSCIHLKLNDFEFSKDNNEKHIYVNLTGSVRENDFPFLCVGRFYSLSRSRPRPQQYKSRNINNVVILKAISHISRETFVLEFKAIDNNTDLKHDTILGNELSKERIQKIKDDQQIDPNLFIFPLNSFFQPNKRQFPYNKYKLSNFPNEKIIENGVNLSYSAEKDNKMFINFGKTKDLAKFISNKSKFSISPIEKIYTERGVYDIASLYHASDYVRAHAKYVNTNYMKSLNDTSISYAFSGIPMHVIHVEFPIDNTSLVLHMKDVDDATFDLLKKYIGDCIYVMDKYNIIWTLNNLFRINRNGEDVIVFTLVNLNENPLQFSNEDRIDLSVERFIFIVPIQYFSFYQLADDKMRLDNFSPNSLAIGTEYIKEKLTVEGSASCKDDLVMYNDNSKSPFTINYDMDTLSLNDKFDISGSNILARSDFEIEGILTANGYLTNSDQKLKTNIQNTDMFNDLKLIENINIHDFDFIHDNAMNLNSPKQKGVIAQEIEKQLPHIVTTKYGVIPNIQKKGKIIKINGEKAIEISNRKNDVNCILKEKPEKINITIFTEDKTSKNIDLCVKEVAHFQPYSLIIKLETNLDDNIDLFSTVFVVGTYQFYKVVDYSFLQMANINAVKALSEKIEKIENILKDKM